MGNLEVRAKFEFYRPDCNNVVMTINNNVNIGDVIKAIIGKLKSASI